MTDLVLLTDAEIAAVSGGAISQSLSITATQSNSSGVTQSASATNSGAVSASASGSYATAAAAGAESNNTAIVRQGNAIAASNSIRFGRH